MILEEASINISPNDINYHLDLMLADFERFQFYNNRSYLIWFFCEKMISNILFIQKLIKSSQTPLANSIVNDTNELFKKDPFLSIVNLRIFNSKRKSNPDAIALLDIHI
jgi:hypothetical protein